MINVYFFAGLYVTYARLNHSCICNTKSIKFHDHRFVFPIALDSKEHVRVCCILFNL